MNDLHFQIDIEKGLEGVGIILAIWARNSWTKPAAENTMWYRRCLLVFVDLKTDKARIKTWKQTFPNWRVQLLKSASMNSLVNSWAHSCRPWLKWEAICFRCWTISCGLVAERGPMVWSWRMRRARDLIGQNAPKKNTLDYRRKTFKMHIFKI